MHTQQVHQGDQTPHRAEDHDGSRSDARYQKKGGRPRKAGSQRRSRKYTVSVNQPEREIIEAKAEAAGMSPSVYLRQAGVGARLSSRVNDRVYHQLSRIGVNVNQMARVANATGRLPELEKLQALLAQILEMREQM